MTDGQQPPSKGADDGGRTGSERSTARDPRSAHDPRTAKQRAADHAAIDRLADELLPALVAKLAATGLGEIEVGEGSWTVRVRRPSDGSAGHTRRATDRASRSQPGHAGHGHTPGAFEGHRTAREAKSPAGHSTNGSSPGTGESPKLDPAQAPAAAARPGDEGGDRYRTVATSPAVGVFQPRPEAKAGTRVRSGDRLGAVDMLGVAQEVVAPADGIVGASLVEAGQTVEYGQELVIIELAGRAPERATERSEA
ncbi:MAG TPA: biotin/lipoyl-containing protein [Candidatus Limnocylindrales bacterium]|nr:biotin/lipoyl-containing protein [Candidatus Limnocylindrales bacterium]